MIGFGLSQCLTSRVSGGDQEEIGETEAWQWHHSPAERDYNDRNS